ncbi:MAG: hypothetical protein P4L65_08615 [Legionella sp.]|nr:hypothetical protein [Legionella sp.]
MPDLNQKFRKAFLNYLKNPHHVKNQNDLVGSAAAIYKDTVSHCGIEPDKYIPPLYELIKSATKSIKLSPDLAKILDEFIRNLSDSELPEKSQAFVVLNIAHNLASPKKSCLREVINNFLITQDVLKKENNVITNRNFAGSFFLSNADVTNIRAKKSVIDNLIQSVSDGIFSKSRHDGQKFFPNVYDIEDSIKHIEKHIDTLSEKQCENILSSLLQKINPILSAQANPYDRREQAEYMTDCGKRSALKVHSFNDNWFFNFLAKMVKSIQEAIGIKTSAEELLENSVNEAEKSGITLK